MRAAVWGWPRALSIFTADGKASCSFQPPHLQVTYSTTSYTKPSNTQLLISAMQHAMACVPRSRIAIDLLAVLRLLDRFWDLRLAWIPSVE